MEQMLTRFFQDIDEVSPQKTGFLLFGYYRLACVIPGTRYARGRSVGPYAHAVNPYISIQLCLCGVCFQHEKICLLPRAFRLAYRNSRGGFVFADGRFSPFEGEIFTCPDPFSAAKIIIL